MINLEKEVQRQLFALADNDYKTFHCRLMPTVDPTTVIGVRIPDLRKFAKSFSQTEAAAIFLQKLPHTYYEENNLHGFLIENLKDYKTTVATLETFLPYVDNWATCDLMSPKIFKNHKAELLPQIHIWLKNEHPFTVRFAVKMLMSFYLEDHFDTSHHDLVATIRSDAYYVNMMIAWYFATALAKQYEATLPYLQQPRLEPWTHNKAIQKAIESRRITPAQKKYLRTLKIKAVTSEPAELPPSIHNAPLGKVTQ